jgi:hypothetical protein
MATLTPEQQAMLDKRAADKKAAKEASAALKSRRDAWRANVGKVYSSDDGDETVTITGFDKSHLFEGVHIECYTVHFGNPNNQSFIGCETFHQQFDTKGAQ